MDEEIKRVTYGWTDILLFATKNASNKIEMGALMHIVFYLV